MAISEDTLERWSKLQTAAIQSGKDTHRHIQNKLNSHQDLTQNDHIQLRTILQGSYANETIVRGSGDVDVLAINQSHIHANYDDMSISGLKQMMRDHNKVNYSYQDYRSDVKSALQDIYGYSAVTDGSKAIELDHTNAPGLKLDADVVPVFRYKEYDDYPNLRAEGVAFQDSAGNWITNFPEQHRDKATEIHQKTNNRYKPTIRIFKRARNKLAEDHGFDQNQAPSYYIECLLSNADENSIDNNDLEQRFLQVLVDVSDMDSWDTFTAQHGLRTLFGDDDDRWSEQDAATFLQEVLNLWEDP